MRPGGLSPQLNLFPDSQLLGRCGTRPPRAPPNPLAKRAPRLRGWHPNPAGHCRGRGRLPAPPATPGLGTWGCGLRGRAPPLGWHSNTSALRLSRECHHPDTPGRRGTEWGDTAARHSSQTPQIHAGTGAREGPAVPGAPQIRGRGWPVTLFQRKGMGCSACAPARGLGPRLPGVVARLAPRHPAHTSPHPALDEERRPGTQGSSRRRELGHAPQNGAPGLSQSMPGHSPITSAAPRDLRSAHPVA